MQPNSYALDFATEADCKLALGSTDEVVEWESIGYSFHKSASNCVIVRTGALGGDVREVHGGWKFANVFTMEMAWQEIVEVAKCFTSTRRVSSGMLAQAVMRKKVW